MAHLNINGIEVPIATNDGIDQEYRDDNIDGEFSQGGVYLRVRGDYKKKWSFKTTPLALALSNPLKDMLNGGGKNWSMNNTLYSSKGKKLTYSRASTKYDESGAIHNSGIQCDEAGQFGTDRCIGLHRGCTNLLTDNEASIETTSGGWGVLGGGVVTLTQDATQYWHGTKSLKVVTDGAAASQGAGGAALTVVTVNLKYTASAWVKGTAGQNLRIVILEYTAASAYVGETQTTFTATGSWQRVQVSRTFGATGAKSKIYIRNNGTYAYTYYIDGAQLERTYYNEGATPWQLPSTPRANEFCYTGYDYSYLNGFTVSFWAYITSQMKDYVSNYAPRLFTTWCNYASPHDFLQLYHSQSSAYWVVYHYDGTTSGTATAADSLTATGWNHFRISYDYNNSTIKLYINNVLAVTVTSAYIPSVAKNGFALVIGNYQNSDSTTPYYYANTKFADVQILDFPTDENWLSPTTFAHSLLPFLKVHGDLVKATSAAPITCIGSVKGSKITYVGKESKEELEVEIEEI